MKKTTLTLILFIAFSQNSYAGDDKFLFWYPGEAGTTEEAQPVLDEFFNYINVRFKTVKLAGKYFNTKESGLNFIKNQKPAIGIVSYSAWEANKTSFPNASIWLATNPLPHGQAQENYLLVGKYPSPSANIFSSEPLSKDFVKNRLGFDIKNDPQPTSGILSKLKAIAEGSVQDSAILTPSEGAAFQRMSAPWTASLKIISKSNPVPTARVILFNPSLKNAADLRRVLLNMRNNPEAKPILDELRLVGFSEP